MSVIQRLQILSRRIPGANQPELFWHGASSINLRSIMLYGLDPNKIKIGNWLADKNTNEINPSKISYGGVYYAKSMFTAYTYGTDISRKFPNSHPLLIAVMLQELAALPDEDMLGINHLFIGFIGQSEIKAAEILVNLLTHAELKWYGGTTSWRKYVDDFRSQVLQTVGLTPEELTKRQDSKRVLGAIDAVLLACCKRYLVHIQTRSGYHDAYSYIRKALRDYAPKLAKKFTDAATGETKLPSKFRLPTPTQGEQAAAKSIDYLIHITRHAGLTKSRLGEQWRRNNHNIRTLQPVGFRGRNRIICIIELIDETGKYDKNRPNEERVKIHYGKPPVEFLQQYRERMSENKPIIWLDKSGKEIGRDPPVTVNNLATDYQFNYKPMKGIAIMPNEDYWVGPPPSNADREFPGIPAELAEEIAQRMDNEKYLGSNRCPLIIARVLQVTGRGKLLTAAANPYARSTRDHEFGALGYKHAKTFDSPILSTQHHHYVPDKNPLHATKVHNYLVNSGYNRTVDGPHSIYSRGLNDEVYLHHENGRVHEIVHVEPKNKHVNARVSPIKPISRYKWHVYHGKPRLISNKRGTSHVLLKKGHRFGLRAATSDPNKIRMIHPHTGKTVVFSLSKHHATRLINHSRPV